MAITVMLDEPKKDKIFINLPNGDIEDELNQMLEEEVEEYDDIDEVDAGVLVDAVFDALDSFGIVFEW